MEEDNKKKLIAVLFENILILTIFMLYFFMLSIFYFKLNEENIILSTKIASIIVLFIGIIIIEFAYRKESGKIGLIGIEALVVSIFTLIMWTIIKRYRITYQPYILYSTFSLVIYYFLKEAIMHTTEKRNYLNNLSDIHEILENEPLKKEAKKRENIQ